MALDREALQPYFLLGLIAVFAVLSVQLIMPYIFYILAAIILVYIAHPAYTYLEEELGHAGIASALTLIMLLVVLVVPTIILTDMVIQEGQNALTTVGTRAGDYINTTTVEELYTEVTGEPLDVDTSIRSAFMEAGTILSGGIPGIIQTVLDAMIGVFIMAVTMYYLFKDGDDLFMAVRHMTPLRTEQKDRLVEELDQMSEAILLGHLLTSTVQGIVAGIGLWAVGIDNVVFWTFVMIVLGLIPIIGNFLVWFPAGLYLIFVQDMAVPGLALLLYCGTLLPALDNLIRIKVVERRSTIHPLLVMIGVIGGIPMFGLLGVVLGPLVLGFFASLVTVYREDFVA